MRRIVIGNIVATVLGALLWWTDAYREYVLFDLRWGYVARALVYITIVGVLFSVANRTGFEKADSPPIRALILVGLSMVEATSLWFIMNMAVVEPFYVAKDGMTLWL